MIGRILCWMELHRYRPHPSGVPHTYQCTRPECLDVHGGHP